MKSTEEFIEHYKQVEAREGKPFISSPTFEYELAGVYKAFFRWLVSNFVVFCVYCSTYEVQPLWWQLFGFSYCTLRLVSEIKKLGYTTAKIRIRVGETMRMELFNYSTYSFGEEFDMKVAIKSIGLEKVEKSNRKCLVLVPNDRHQRILFSVGEKEMYPRDEGYN